MVTYLWLIVQSNNDNRSVFIMGPGLLPDNDSWCSDTTSSAFREVQSSFLLFLHWTRITELRSIYKRLNEFEKLYILINLE